MKQVSAECTLGNSAVREAAHLVHLFWTLKSQLQLAVSAAHFDQISIYKNVLETLKATKRLAGMIKLTL